MEKSSKQVIEELSIFDDNLASVVLSIVKLYNLENCLMQIIDINCEEVILVVHAYNDLNHTIIVRKKEGTWIGEYNEISDIVVV